MREYKTLRFFDDDGMVQKKQAQDMLRHQGWEIQSESRITSDKGSEVLVEFYRDSRAYEEPLWPPVAPREPRESRDRMPEAESPWPSTYSRRSSTAELDYDDEPPMGQRRRHYSKRRENHRGSRFFSGLIMGLLLGALGGFGGGWWHYALSPALAPTPSAGPRIVIPNGFAVPSAPESSVQVAEATAAPETPAPASEPAAAPASELAPAPAQAPAPTPTPSASPARPAQRRGVVTSSSVNIRHQPSTSTGQRIGSATYHQELTVLEERDTGEQYPWYRVSGSFGEGWIYGRYLRIRQ